MKRFHLIVENSTTKHLEELEYKILSSQNIIQSMLSQSTDKTFAESSAFQMLMNRHDVIIADWEITKRDVPQTCFPTWLQSCGCEFTWDLDTHNKDFTITLMSDIDIPELNDYDVEDVVL